MLIGVDIGGSHIGAGVVQHGSILKTVHKVFNAATASAEDLVNLVADLVKQVCDSSKDTGLSKKTLRAIGIGCPGQCKDGVLIAASNFPNVRNLNITSIISEKFDGVPCALFNDADAAMAAEIWCAGSTPLEHAAMISEILSAFFFLFSCYCILNSYPLHLIALGTGIGVSLVLNGALFQGASGLIEAGHMILAKDGRCCSCGQRGCAEAYSSATNTHSKRKILAVRYSPHTSSQYSFLKLSIYSSIYGGTLSAEERRFCGHRYGWQRGHRSEVCVRKGQRWERHRHLCA